MTTIEVPVDAETARAYQTISPVQKERISSVVSGLVKESATADARSLIDLAHELGREAVANGLTEDILRDLLREP